MKIKLLVLLVMLIGCNFNNHPENDIKVFCLEGPEKIEKISLSDLGLKSIRYIPLETLKESTITSGSNMFFHEYNFNKIIQTGNSIFFRNGHNIFKFDNSGNFQSVLNPVGRGPGEVTLLSDFDVEEKTHCIYILSGWEKKINIYNDTGEYLRKIELPFYCHEMEIFENGIMLFCGNNSGINEYNFIVIDLNGSILMYFRNNYRFTQKSGYGFTHENIFYQIENQLCKKEIYSDTIYSFNNGSFTPRLVISAGSRLITPEIRAERDRNYIGINYNQPISLFEFGGYVFHYYVYKYNPPNDVLFCGFIGSMKDDFSVIYDAGTGIVNDLDCGPNFQPLCVLNDRELLSLIDPLSLKSFVKSDDFKNSDPKYTEKKLKLEKLADSLKETDNPVLVLVK